MPHLHMDTTSHREPGEDEGSQPKNNFIIRKVSFAVQKLLSLIGSHLFIFVFVSITVENSMEVP